MGDLKSLCVNRIKLAKGATGFGGGQVELNNGDMLNSEVVDLFNDGYFWYVLMDVAVKFGEYDEESNTPNLTTHANTKQFTEYLNDIHDWSMVNSNFYLEKPEDLMYVLESKE